MSRDDQVRTMVGWAGHYRTLGWNPLATCGRLGHPPYPHTTVRDAGQSPQDFAGRYAEAGDVRIAVPAIQLATGARWGLCVVDLDGPMAREVWADWSRFRERPPTWEVDTPSGGRHIYYRTPPDCGSFPWRIVWRLRDGGRDRRGNPTHVKHELIEILGDGRLAMAPPSIRVRPDRRGVYRFAPGRSPREVPAVAPIPAWVAGLPSQAPARVQPGSSSTPRPIPASRPAGRSYDFAEVLGAISRDDKIDLVRSWNLRLVGRTDSQWVRCHAVGREDHNPSGRFSPDFGYYAEPGQNVRMSLFDLAVAVGVSPSPSSACNALGAQFLPRRSQNRRQVG